MLADVIRFFSIYLVLLLFIFCLGFSVLRLFKNTFVASGFHTKNFVSLLFGLIILVFLFSVFRSRFLTVTIFFPLVFFLAFYRKKIRFHSAESDEAERSGLFLLATPAFLILMPFIYFCFVLFKEGAFHFSGVHYDNAVYSELSGYLADTGLENKWYMFFSDTSSLKGIEPYHYVELWLNGFVHSIFNANLLQSLYLVTYPLLLSISMFGILAITEHFKKIGLLEVLLSFFLLAIGPVYQIKQLDFHFNTIAGEIPMQEFGEKFSVYYPFIILAILLALNNYFKEAGTWLLSLCIVSSTLLPAFVPGFLFLLVVLPGKKKNAAYKAVLFFIALILFYAIFKRNDQSSASARKMLNYTDLATFELSMQWLKLAVSNFWHALLSSFLHFSAVYFYAFILLPVFFYKKSAFARPLSGILIFCLCGLGMGCLFYKLPDSYQLFTNTLPLLHCSMITCLVILLCEGQTNKVSRCIVLAFVFIFSVNALYCSIYAYKELNTSLGVSDAYLVKVKSLLAKEPGRQRIGFICNQADYNQLKARRNSNYLYHLSYLGINPIPIKLSCVEINDPSTTQESRNDYRLAKEQDLFYKYYLNEGKPGKDLDNIKLKFLKTYSINYLLLSPTVEIPSFLKERNSTYVTDAKTGIRFMRFQPQSPEIR